MPEKNSKYLFRSFVSTLLLFSFSVLVFTGLILFITPPGRVAHWTGWEILGLGKEQWAAVHIIFAILVTIVSILHVYLNFKPMLNYFKDRVSKKFAVKMEWIAAALVCLALFLGTVAAIPPFSSIMEIHDEIKFGWERPAEKAPLPHAESMTLAEIAKKTDFELNTMISNLEKAEMGPAKPQTVLDQLAGKYNMTPMQVFRIATGQKGKSGHENIKTQSGSCGGGKKGLGKKTLKQFCREENIDIHKALERLKAAGIEAKADDNLKAIAEKSLTKPHKIVDIVSSEKK